MIEETAKFRNDLLIELEIKLKDIDKEQKYADELKSKIEEIETQNDDYNHPIKWLISGCAGVHAFIIGTADLCLKQDDRNIEKNYYPPSLINNLSKMGNEFIYSQIAIVIVSENSDESILSWLRKWCDDPRYLRKVISISEKPREVKLISDDIVEKYLYPWQTIKHFQDIEYNHQQQFIENDLEEEEND